MRLSFLTTLAVCAGLAGLVNLANAADEPARDRNAAAARDNDNHRAKVDKKTDGDALRLSQVCGMTVRNAAGEDLGEIKDVMLDMGHEGRARYAALSFGGFLGLGDKLFAIPWQSLKFHHDTDKDESFVVFNTSEEELKNMPGFDKDHWPDMADNHWMTGVDKHHKVTVNAGDTSVRVGTDRRDADRDARHNKNGKGWRLHRASQAEDMNVRNENGDKLGSVEDIVVAMNSGKIRYVAMSFGGFLGIGDKFFAVPWDEVRLQYDADDDDYFIAFDATKEGLENAPGFDKDHWPNFGDEKWAATNDRAYTAHRPRRQERTTRTRVE